MPVYTYLRALALAKSGRTFDELLMAAMMVGDHDDVEPLLQNYPHMAREVAERSQRVDHYSPTYDDMKG